MAQRQVFCLNGIYIVVHLICLCLLYLVCFLVNICVFIDGDTQREEGVCGGVYLAIYPGQWDV